MAFLNRLTALGEGVFPMSSVAVQPLKWIAPAGVWIWEADVRLSRSSSATGCKEGEGRWAAKISGEVNISETFGRPCLACWWPTQHNATAVPLGLGMGALEDAIGSCAWQGPILTDERRLPKAQGTSDPFGPDLQTVSLGWEGLTHRCIGCGGQRVGRSQECYNWNSLPRAYVFILESLKELWICWVRIRLRWRAQEQSSSLWQAIYYGWLAGLKSECDSSLCLL